MKKTTIELAMSEELSYEIELLVDKLFSHAVELADAHQFEEAIQLANDALVIAKYGDIGYRKIYILGMLCSAYIDSDQPEQADIIFKEGMKFIEKCEEGNERDMNSLLDLKVIIERELMKIGE